MIDITGNKYNRLKAIKLAHKTDREYWLFQCDCGNQKVINKASVVTGRTKSCGCLKIEKTSKLNFIDGRKKNPLYPIWRGIVQRCIDTKNKSYKDYGGRGISISKEWLSDFNSFRKWCLSNGWDKDLEIDRIDNNAGYCPENCRFVKRIDNARNKRSNIKIYYKNKEVCLKELSEITNISYQRIKTAYHNGKINNLIKDINIHENGDLLK